MAAISDLFGFDIVTLKGDPLERARAALRIARHEVRRAYDETGSWRLENALEAVEEDIGAHLRRIETAVADDADEFAQSAEGIALRQAELPLRVA